ALTQPRDPAKLDALAKKRGLQTRTVGGWTALARDGAALDALGATPSLAQSDVFAAAMKRIPGAAVLRAYAAPSQAQMLLGQVPGLSTMLARPGAAQQTAKTQYAWAAAKAALTAKGIELDGYVRTVEPHAPRVGRSAPLQEPAA